MSKHPPLKLLFLNPTGVQVWGGVEAWMLAVAQGLHDRGYSISAAGRPAGRFLETMSAAGFPGLAIRGRNDFSPKDILRLRRFIRAHSIDVVITKLNRGIRLAGTAVFLAGGRRAVMAHMGLMEAKSGLGSRLAYRMFLTGINVPCHSIRERLVRDRGFAPDAVHVVPYGVDTTQFEPDAEERREVRGTLGFDEQPLVSMVARLDDQKGHSDFLQALTEVEKAHALIVGTGALDGPLRQQAGQLGLDSRVRFLGHREDVRSLLRGSDLLVLSSYDEGLPFVVLEAMAVGLPVVATRVGGLEEVVKEGKTGYLVPPGDPAALAAAIRKVLEAPNRGEALGRAGRSLVLENYLETGMVNEVEKVLHELLRRKRGGNESGRGVE